MLILQLFLTLVAAGALAVPQNKSGNSSETSGSSGSGHHARPKFLRSIKEIRADPEKSSSEERKSPKYLHSIKEIRADLERSSSEERKNVGKRPADIAEWPTKIPVDQSQAAQTSPAKETEDDRQFRQAVSQLKIALTNLVEQHHPQANNSAFPGAAPTIDAVPPETTEVLTTSEEIEKIAEIQKPFQQLKSGSKSRPRAQSAQELRHFISSERSHTSQGRGISSTYTGPRHTLERAQRKKQRGATTIQPTTTTFTTTTITTTTTTEEPTTEAPTKGAIKKVEKVVVPLVPFEYPQPRIIAKVLQDNRKSGEEKRDYMEEIAYIQQMSCPTTKRYIEEVLNGKVSEATEQTYLNQHLYLFSAKIKNLVMWKTSQDTLASKMVKHKHFRDLSAAEVQETVKFIVLVNDAEDPDRPCEDQPKAKVKSVKPPWK